MLRRPNGPEDFDDVQLVMFEHSCEGAYGRLVARDDGDQSLHVVRREVKGHAVVNNLAADEREPHAVSAVQLPVGYPDCVRGRDEPDR